jgi:anaerobic selenocysteine-containing dehydrogenase
VLKLKVVKTVCHRDCPDTCFIDVTVKDGKILSTRGSHENPVTQGFLCPRGMGDTKRIYSEKRILHPYMRKSADKADEFSKESWGKALSTIADRLQETLARHGPESVLLYDYPGNQGLLSWQFPRRLWFALSATTTDYSLCSNSGHTAIGLHYGLTYGIQPEELQGMDVITFWGNNAKVSSSHQWSFASKARKNREAIIVDVDPRKSPTSEAADIWLNPRPGSDVALAYGIARFIILNNGVDRKFIDDWTIGYEKFENEALSWTPDRVERVTGLSWDQVETVGNLYIHKRPAAFMIGLGLQKSSQGTEAVRAISLLPALLGYHRGFHYSDSKGRFVDWAYVCGSSLTQKQGRVVNQVSIGPRLESGEFKFVFVLGSNPAITLPDQTSVRKGLLRDDLFLVVQDTHWSETAYFADIILPAATYYEKSDVNFSDHHLYSRLSNKAIEPLGESWHEIKVMQEIASRLQLSESWLFEDPWHALEIALQGTFTEKSLSDLLHGESLKLKLRPNREYQTPSGKIEFSSSKSYKIGVGEIPVQTEVNMDDEWCLLLNSSIPQYTHSQFTDVYGPIPQIVWVNEDSAKRLKIHDDDEVILYNELGEVHVKAVVNEKVSEGVLWAPRPLIGLMGNPLNVLTSNMPQIIGGGPNFNSTRVKIRGSSGK